MSPRRYPGQVSTVHKVYSVGLLTQKCVASCVCQGIRITRCGYTGEDGFEISVSWKDATALTDMLLHNNDVKLSGRHGDHCWGTGTTADVCALGCGWQAWGRVTRCVWKPACASTAMTSTPPPRPSRYAHHLWHAQSCHTLQLLAHPMSA